MNDLPYRYRLEEHPKKKGTCPGCSKKGVFRYYEDAHGNRLDEQYGRCDRENQCTYHRKPDLAPDPVSFARFELPPEPDIIRPPYEMMVRLLDCTLSHKSNFHLFCNKLTIPNDHLQAWYVGTDNDKTVFLLVDRSDTLVNAKWFRYLPSGKRDKNLISFSLKQPHKRENKKYGMCLYGEHRLDPEKQKPVCLVESEKSAVIASFFYPAYDWLATGSANGLTHAKVEALYNRKVIWLADADKAGRDNSSIKLIKSYGINFHYIDLFPDRQDGYDIADAIIDGLRPEITLPKPEPEKPDGNVDPYDSTQFIPKDAFAEEGNRPDEDLEEYGFFKMRNQYWKMEKSGYGFKPCAFSNFCMRVLFHIDNGKVPRRIIEIINTKGKKKTLDTETANLTSIGRFKEFIEGAGNYLFDGSAVELGKLKRKLFDEEKACRQIETLGWHDAGFYTFSNGIYNCEFKPVDENGIVDYHNESFYIPSGNETYANNRSLFSNEKKFKYYPNPVNFQEWSALFYRVYGDPGMVSMVFGVASLFSDIVFSQYNFFPMLFLYGEGGSGKGSQIRSIQHLFGTPQDPLTLSGKANTDKAKVREFAQFVNSIICLEEFTNSKGDDSIQFLKNLWDRYGYKRARMDSGFGTESVPINSAVMITGNEYPTDDPLLQRLVVLEINVNERTQEARDNYARLNELEKEGITAITGQLLQLRKHVEENYRETHKKTQKEISALLADIRCTDRMINNVTVLCTIYKLASEQFQFPFVYDHLKNVLFDITRRQNDKRDTGGEVQKFWDTVLYLLNSQQIKHGREIKINGNEVMIRYKELHNLYLIAHSQLYRAPGLQQVTLLDKLKKSEGYLEYKDSARFADNIKSSCHSFQYDKLGVDLFSVIEYQKGEAAKYNSKGDYPTAGDLSLDLQTVTRTDMVI